MFSIVEELWKVTHVGQLNARVDIPDTFVFIDKEISWYFLSKTGKILQQKPENCNINQIQQFFENMKEKEVNNQYQPLMALYQLEDNNNSQQILKYLTYSDFQQFYVSYIQFNNLQFENDIYQKVIQKNLENKYHASGNQFIIQKHVFCKQEKHNHVISLMWHPNLVLGERKINSYIPEKYGTAPSEIDKYQYLVTYEGPDYFTSDQPLNEGLSRQLKEISDSIVQSLQFLHATRGKVKQLRLFFKKVDDNKLYLMNCTELVFQADEQLPGFLRFSFQYKLTLPNEILHSSDTFSSVKEFSKPDSSQADLMNNRLHICQSCGAPIKLSSCKQVTQNNLDFIRSKRCIRNDRNQYGILSSQQPQFAYDFANICEACFQAYTEIFEEKEKFAKITGKSESLNQSKISLAPSACNQDLQQQNESTSSTNSFFFTHFQDANPSGNRIDSQSDDLHLLIVQQSVHKGKSSRDITPINSRLENQNQQNNTPQYFFNQQYGEVKRVQGTYDKGNRSLRPLTSISNNSSFSKIKNEGLEPYQLEKNFVSGGGTQYPPELKLENSNFPPRKHSNLSIQSNITPTTANTSTSKRIINYSHNKMEFMVPQLFDQDLKMQQDFSLLVSMNNSSQSNQNRTDSAGAMPQLNQLTNLIEQREFSGGIGSNNSNRLSKFENPNNSNQVLLQEFLKKASSFHFDSSKQDSEAAFYQQPEKSSSQQISLNNFSTKQSIRSSKGNINVKDQNLLKKYQNNSFDFSESEGSNLIADNNFAKDQVSTTSFNSNSHRSQSAFGKKNMVVEQTSDLSSMEQPNLPLPKNGRPPLIKKQNQSQIQSDLYQQIEGNPAFSSLNNKIENDLKNDLQNAFNQIF